MSSNAHIRKSLERLTEIITLMLRVIGRLTIAISAGADINDLATDLSHLDNAVFRLSNTLAQIHAFHNRIADPIREMVVHVDRTDLLILRTPYLIRRKYPTYEGHCVFSPLVQHALSYAPLMMRDQASEITVDILSVFPTGTKTCAMADPDNINPKRVIDLATMALGLDDNGAITTLSIDAIRCDQVSPGTYTVIRPRATRADNNHPLLRLIIKEEKNEEAD